MFDSPLGFRALQVENRKKTRSHAPALYRVLGFLDRRARVNPSRFWFRFDAAEIADVLGVSLRTVRNVKAKIADNPKSYGYEFRTVYDHDNGRKGSWQLVFAPIDRLKYDRDPLHKDRDGRDRHVRENQRQCNYARKLAYSGVPTFQKSERSECNPIKREATPLSRDTPRRGRECGEISPAGKERLWRKAAAVGRRLESLHWQFQRVDFSFHAARRLAFEAILAGFLESEIRTAYERSLWEAASFASDLQKQFNASSTLTRTRRRLDADPRSRQERMSRFFNLN